jgi:hypothetical protein
MLLICCQKNDGRQAFNWQCAQDFEAVHAWHLDIEEYNIGRLFQYLLHCGLPVSAFSNYLNIPEFTQPENDATARQGLVVDD